jgi:hypothetical protein
LPAFALYPCDNRALGRAVLRAGHPALPNGTSRVSALEGGRMPLFLSKFSYTPETWARLIANPEDRRKTAQAYIESVGGKLHGSFISTKASQLHHTSVHSAGHTGGLIY